VSIFVLTSLIGCGDPDDGFTYKGPTIKIGSLTWMAKNLNQTTEYGEGWCYNYDNLNCEKYGRLYTWDEANTVCSELSGGWRLPTDAEWSGLVSVVGGGSVAGGKLKSKTGWNDRSGGISGNGTDEYNFSALPGGVRLNNGAFRNVGNDGYWWSASTATVGGFALGRGMNNYDSVMDTKINDQRDGFSVRCVKD